MRSEKEVYEHFKDKFEPGEDGTPNPIAVFAYGLFESDRYEWMDHFAEEHQAPPNRDDLDRYIRERPPQYYDRLLEYAEEWFTEFAREYLNDDIEEEISDAVNESVQGELVKIRAFGPQLWNNTIGSVAGNLLTAVLIVLLAIQALGPGVLDWMTTSASEINTYQSTGNSEGQD